MSLEINRFSLIFIKLKYKNFIIIKKNVFFFFFVLMIMIFLNEIIY